MAQAYTNLASGYGWTIVRWTDLSATNQDGEPFQTKTQPAFLTAAAFRTGSGSSPLSRSIIDRCCWIRPFASANDTVDIQGSMDGSNWFLLNGWFTTAHFQGLTGTSAITADVMIVDSAH